MSNVLTENKFLNDEELAHLLDTCNRHLGERDSLLIRLILFSGCRGVEVRRIRKKDLTGMGVFITAAKGSNDRTLPLAPMFLKELKAYAKDMAEDTIIFNVAERTLRHVWDKWRPNKNKGVHSLRHSFGVRFFLNCENIHATQTALGHVNVESTMIYLDFVYSQQKLRKLSKGMWSRKLHDVA